MIYLGISKKIVEKQSIGIFKRFAKSNLTDICRHNFQTSYQINFWKISNRRKHIPNEFPQKFPEQLPMKFPNGLSNKLQTNCQGIVEKNCRRDFQRDCRVNNQKIWRWISKCTMCINETIFKEDAWEILVRIFRTNFLQSNLFNDWIF